MKTASEIAASILGTKANARVRRKAVDSENLRSVGFNLRTLELSIRFWAKPDVYVFRNLPAKVHKALMAAHSHGEFFSKYIADVYPFTVRKG